MISFNIDGIANILIILVISKLILKWLYNQLLHFFNTSNTGYKKKPYYNSRKNYNSNNYNSRNKQFNNRYNSQYKKY